MQSPYPDVILTSTLQWYPLLPREAYPPWSTTSGMSLSEHMYGPHVLVCVRARGAFQKTKQNKKS